MAQYKERYLKTQFFFVFFCHEDGNLINRKLNKRNTRVRCISHFTRRPHSEQYCWGKRRERRALFKIFFPGGKHQVPNVPLSFTNPRTNDFFYLWNRKKLIGVKSQDICIKIDCTSKLSFTRQIIERTCTSTKCNVTSRMRGHGEGEIHLKIYKADITLLNIPLSLSCT